MKLVTCSYELVTTDVYVALAGSLYCLVIGRLTSNFRKGFIFDGSYVSECYLHISMSWPQVVLSALSYLRAGVKGFDKLGTAC